MQIGSGNNKSDQNRSVTLSFYCVDSSSLLLPIKVVIQSLLFPPHIHFSFKENVYIVAKGIINSLRSSRHLVLEGNSGKKTVRHSFLLAIAVVCFDM